ncbi:MAG: metallophosphoesterase family protein [Pseudomonadota bacterium]
MRIRDLGTVTGRLLVFGAPHSNARATAALFETAEAMNVTPRNMLCTGDIVGIGAGPAETIERLYAAGVPVVKGDCDAHLAWSGAESISCADMGPQGAARTAAWHQYATTHVKQAVRERLATLPDHIRFQHRGKRYVAIHGGAQRRTAFLWPTVSDATLAAEISALKSQHGRVDGVICGHSGLAFERIVSGVRWINSGSVGLPAHDGNPQTRFATLEPSGEIVFHRLSYDHDAERQAMIEADLTHGYEDTLVTGRWPVESGLPPELRWAAKPVFTPEDDVQARSA